MNGTRATQNAPLHGGYGFAPDPTGELTALRQTAYVVSGKEQKEKEREKEGVSRRQEAGRRERETREAIVKGKVNGRALICNTCLHL